MNKRIRVALLAGNPELGDMLRRFESTFPENYATRVFTADEEPSWWEFDYTEIRRFAPDVLLVWNADMPGWKAAARMCAVELFGGGRLIDIENGWFPQTDNWLCRPVESPTGGWLPDSWLWPCRDTDYVDLDYLQAYLTEHFPYRECPVTDGPYALVVGQLYGDSNTTHSGNCFASTYDFEYFAKSLVAKLPIPTYFAPHPLERCPDRRGHLLMTDPSIPTIAYAEHAAVIIGLSSTVLFESLAYQQRPIVLGRPHWWRGALGLPGPGVWRSLLTGNLPQEVFQTSLADDFVGLRVEQFPGVIERALRRAITLQFPAEQFSEPVEQVIQHSLRSFHH